MKGQVSFDLIIAILVLLIVVQLFQGVIADAAASQESISIRTQQKTIGRELARVIDSAVMLSSKEQPEFPFEIEYTIPQVYSAKQLISAGCVKSPDCTCTINIARSANYDIIGITTQNGDEPITTEIKWISPGGQMPAMECGETIKINQDWVG